MATESDLQGELEVLSERLEDRQSIVHFAWCFGLSCVAFMSTGVALKLFHDSARTPKIAFVLAVAGVGCGIVALVRLVSGLGRYRTELQDFARLTEVRQQLGLDSPPLTAQLPNA